MYASHILLLISKVLFSSCCNVMKSAWTLSDLPQPPLLFNATTSSLLEEANALNDQLDQVIGSLVSNANSNANPSNPLTSLDCLTHFARNENDRLTRSKHVKFYASTHPDKEIRDASSNATKILVDKDLKLFHNKEFFAVFRTLWQCRDELEGEKKRYVEKLYSEFEERGACIETDVQRARLHEIQQRLSDLTRQGIRNLNSDRSGVWCSRQDLDGLPEHVLQRASLAARTIAQASEDARRNEAVAEEVFSSDQYWITMKDPDVLAVRKHATNARTRRLVSSAHANRCPQNKPIYQEVFALRDEVARIMGYPNHAAFRLKYKMLGDVHVVEDFLESVIERLRPAKDAELKNMRSIKQAELLHAADLSLEDVGQCRIHSHDTAYYDRIVKERTFSSSQVAVSEYFPLEHALAGLFSTYEHLLGIKFCAVEDPGTDMLWHSSVKIYTVWDDDLMPGSFLGYLYLDLFPRDGKYTHAGHYALSPVSQYLFDRVPSLLPFPSFAEWLIEKWHTSHYRSAPSASYYYA